MQKLRILHQDTDLVVFEKPAGILVHPPEDPEFRKYTSGATDVLRILREQVGAKVFPVHRLDRATHGVMVMALRGEIASALQKQFVTRSVNKNYLLLCRGWTDDRGVIDSELSSEIDGGAHCDAVTEYETLHRFEVPVATGKHNTSRFSLVRADPKTGRFHQIRRHFRKIAHPLIGDTVHGDGHQNRIWREITGVSRLYLTAWQLEFEHPNQGMRMSFRTRFSKHWHPVFDQAGFCPLSRNF
jgi:tRNA pseudouridine65 synthase